MTGEGFTSNGPSQVDNVEGAAPVAAPRPPPMTTQQIAAYRSGEDPDFDPVERRGWWEVDLAQGVSTLQKLLLCSFGRMLHNFCFTAFFLYAQLLALLPHAVVSLPVLVAAVV